MIEEECIDVDANIEAVATYNTKYINSYTVELPLFESPGNRGSA